MIYKNVFFFHIPKGGGSSIEKMFLNENKFLDFTINVIFKETKFSKFFVGTLRSRVWRIIVWGLVGLFFFDKENIWGVRKGKALQHLTYQEVINEKYLTEEKLNSLIKFCIVRNPYDRMISAYHFIGGNSKFSDFVKYVHLEVNNYYRKNIEPFVVIMPQIEFIIDAKGDIKVENILYFENLNKDFKDFCDKNSLELGEIPHINRRNRNKSSIKEYYNQELADIVYEMYRLDFKIFGYKKLLFKRKKRKKLIVTTN